MSRIMAEPQRTYIAIDLKSFYASVECVDRGLDPLTTNLVVAEVSRTEKTICLAVSPSLKAYGIGTNMYLCKVAMDIMAKKAPADSLPRRLPRSSAVSPARWTSSPTTRHWRSSAERRSSSVRRNAACRRHSWPSSSASARTPSCAA